MSYRDDKNEVDRAVEFYEKEGIKYQKGYVYR